MTKRHLKGVAFSPFLCERDIDLFQIERNILARIVYKNTAQYRRNEIMNRIKAVVKVSDKLMQDGNDKLVPHLLQLIKIASERFFQQLSMGLMIPISMVCVGCLARLYELLRRLPYNSPVLLEQDEGEPVDRYSQLCLHLL